MLQGFGSPQLMADSFKCVWGALGDWVGVCVRALDPGVGQVGVVCSDPGEASRRLHVAELMCVSGGP